MRISKKQQQLLDLTDGTDLRQTVMNLYEYMKDMPTQRPDVASHWEAKNHALHMLGLVAEVIDDIDYTNLAWDDRKKLAGVLLRMQQIKRYFARTSLQYDWYTLYLINAGNAFVLAKMNVSRQFANMHGICSTIIDRQRTQQTTVEKPQITHKPGQQFPNYRAKNADLNRALDRLRIAWEEVSLRTLNAEDSFLINAIAASYLPDAWRLLQQLTNHSDLARQRGEEMFLKQITIMQEQVDALLAKVETSVLSEMAAHTAFLENRMADNKSKLDFTP